MSGTPVYSTLFHCLYDQPEPIGSLGRGAHYSVFRVAERFDVELKPAVPPQIHDFAVIWDEDHDTRVIEAVECLYMHDLLAPVQFVGERKGTLSLILAARGLSYMGLTWDQYKARAQEAINQMSHGDWWPVEIGSFDRRPGNPHQNDPGCIVQADVHRVEAYLLSIDTLWNLGTRPWQPGFGHPKADQSLPPMPPLFPPSIATP